jgi:hypothetical protein
MRRRQWVGVTIAILAFIVGAVVNQALGDAGTHLLQWIFSGILASVQSSLWPWALTFLFLLTTIVALCVAWVFNRARTTANNILELDDSLTRLFASWLPNGDHTRQLKGLLQELLRDACREFGRYVQRACILLPEQPAGEYLSMWVSHGMPEEVIERAKFYIGADARLGNLQGVAGRAFLRECTQIAHITKVRTIWQCDCPGFIRFTTGEDAPAYHTFVCVPIIGAALPFSRHQSTACLGILCFDSLFEKVFDGSHAERVLRVFARRIAFALLMSELLPGQGLTGITASSV